MIKLNALWIFSDKIKDPVKPNNSIYEVNNRIQLTNDLLYITKLKDDKDIFNSNLPPRTELRLEYHKLDNEKLYNISFNCNIDDLDNANFFQIMNRNNNKAYPILQLEKRGNNINTRERFNAESTSTRITRYYHKKGFYQFDIYFKTGNNGIIKLLINNQEVLNYNGPVVYENKSWFQFGVYGDKDKNSTMIFKYIFFDFIKEIEQKKINIVNLKVYINDNNIFKVEY